MEFIPIRILLLLVIIIDTSIGETSFTLMVPRVVYYDSDIVASVTAFDVPKAPVKLNLEYKGVRDNSKVLKSTTLEFLSDGLQNWTVIFSWEFLQQNDETEVKLVMSSCEGTACKTNAVNLSFAQNFGHIFIQTDKPVYTPNQTVFYRVIAVDEQQRLSKYNISIEVKNDKQFSIERRETTAREAFRAQEIALPLRTLPGIWTISASFKGLKHTSSRSRTVSFEVKEYVLKRFYTDIEISPAVITKNTSEIVIKGTVSYFFDKWKKVKKGTVLIQLGTFDSHNGLQLFKQPFFTELKDGFFIWNVSSVYAELCNISGGCYHGSKLYVKINVTETASKESDIVENISTYIADYGYIVNFERSKKHFKPGFPYSLQLQVLYIDGKPASNVPLRITTKMHKGSSSSTVQTSKNQTGSQGNFSDYYIIIPESTTEITFGVTILDQPGYTEISHKVKKYYSQTNEYIHISVIPPEPDTENYTVELSYTKPKDLNFSYKDFITILILTKGHIVYTTSTDKNYSGISRVKLPNNLYKEVVPRMRIIAYYYLQNTASFVIDTLVYETKLECLDEEVGILMDKKTGNRPDTPFSVEIFGSPNMLVGLVALDTAVLRVKNDMTLSRDLLFAELGSHDSGTASGDGIDFDDVLLNSGLHHMTLPPPQTETSLDDNSAMHKEPQIAKSVQLRETIGQNPPQSTRDYFPESWMVIDMVLPMDKKYLDLKCKWPSVLTTWSFVAVGISMNRGVCVSTPVEQYVFKLFFAEFKLPRQVKRLEVVEVKITVHNYHETNLTVTMTVTGGKELCFLENQFLFEIKSHSTEVKPVKFIPLHIGDYTVTVEVKSHQDFDKVNKKLHVVAEGQKVKKSITFVLDPEAKHGTVRSKRQTINLFNSSAYKNVYDLGNKIQRTTIDLALPAEVIIGSEFCSISAFGDLMGDIINSSVVKSKNGKDSKNATVEDILGDLAPSVYALQYASHTSLMDDKLREKGQKFIKKGETELKSKLTNHSFPVRIRTNSSTWLTAFALKTFCHASSLASIDLEIIDKGIKWLLEQVNSNGTVNEQDWRLAKNSHDHQIMLAAEVLIAILECNKSHEEQALICQGQISEFLVENLQNITDPTVLAKVTYAIMLFDSDLPEYKEFLEKLRNKRKKKPGSGHIYWSSLNESVEGKQVSFWYHSGAQASAIEATAYALIIYVQEQENDTDAIADWLVGQRNHDGTFIGALDSTAAIQALAKYSGRKHGVTVDLSCFVSLDQKTEYFDSFKFTAKNATYTKSVNIIPVGQVLDVTTKGQGLGQMQVNVEYNIPIVVNAQCQFKVKVEVNRTLPPSMNADNRNELCASCNFGCPKKNVTLIKVKLPNVALKNLCKNNGTSRREGSKCIRPKPRSKKGEKKEQSKEIPPNHRQARSAKGQPASSKKSICIQVCLHYLKKVSSDPTEVRIEMLTGYRPDLSDVQMITKTPSVISAVFDDDTDVLIIRLKGICCKRKICVGFRAVAIENIDRLMPAVIEVKQIGTATPQCALEYHPPIEDDNSLMVYCANSSNSNMKECKCLSRLCSYCLEDNKLNYESSKKLTCGKKFVYQVQMGKPAVSELWTDMDAKVLTVLNRTGFDNITVESTIKLTKPNFCTCPSTTEKVYMLAEEVEKFVNKNGKEIFRCLLDEKSTFLKVKDSRSHVRLTNLFNQNYCPT